MVEVSKIYSHFLAGPEGLGKKTSKLGHNELLGYVEFIGVSSTINP
jgi:hypothetical protein